MLPQPFTTHFSFLPHIRLNGICILFLFSHFLTYFKMPCIFPNAIKEMTQLERKKQTDKNQTRKAQQPHPRERHLRLHRCRLKDAAVTVAAQIPITDAPNHV